MYLTRIFFKKNFQVIIKSCFKLRAGYNCMLTVIKFQDFNNPGISFKFGRFKGFQFCEKFRELLASVSFGIPREQCVYYCKTWLIPVFIIYSILNNFLAKCVEENRNGEREKCDYHQQGPQKTSSNELIATSQMVTRGVLHSAILNI